MIEAKDTVKPELDTESVYRYAMRLSMPDFISYIERIKLFQAGISFEAGIQEGQKQILAEN